MEMCKGCGYPPELNRDIINKKYFFDCNTDCDNYQITDLYKTIRQALTAWNKLNKLSENMVKDFN